MEMSRYYEKVAMRIKEEYPDADFEIHPKRLNNGEIIEGLVVRISGPDDRIGRSVYPCQFEEAGIPVEEAAEKMLEMLKGDLHERLNNGLADKFLKFDSRLVCPRLVNRSANPDVVCTCPSRVVMGDLLLYYSMVIVEEDGTRLATAITDGLAEYYGVTEEQLYGYAMENLCKEARMMTMLEMMKKQLAEARKAGLPVPDEEELLMMTRVNPLQYVVTVKNVEYGAAAILLPWVQERLSEVFGGSYVIIPSSIHEVMIMGEADPEMLSGMIQEVNREELPSKDMLSQHAYIKRWNSSEIEPYVA